jgi:hypothetical protein
MFRWSVGRSVGIIHLPTWDLFPARAPTNGSVFALAISLFAQVQPHTHTRRDYTRTHVWALGKNSRVSLQRGPFILRAEQHFSFGRKEKEQKWIRRSVFSLSGGGGGSINLSHIKIK